MQGGEDIRAGAQGESGVGGLSPTGGLIQKVNRFQELEARFLAVRGRSNGGGSRNPRH